MPTIEELNAMSQAVYHRDYNEPSMGGSEVRMRVMELCLAQQRNSVLGDILTTLDRIQNDTDSMAKVMWDA